MERTVTARLHDALLVALEASHQTLRHNSNNARDEDMRSRAREHHGTNSKRHKCNARQNPNPPKRAGEGLVRESVAMQFHVFHPACRHMKTSIDETSATIL
jgi:hypothetical protein